MFKLLLLLASKKGVIRLQVFGDLMTMIKWMRVEQKFTNFIFPPLLEEVRGTYNLFNTLSFDHIYKERNFDANTLLEARVDMVVGQ
jgi:hypothetical protein